MAAAKKVHRRFHTTLAQNALKRTIVLATVVKGLNVEVEKLGTVKVAIQVGQTGEEQSVAGLGGLIAKRARITRAEFPVHREFGFAAYCDLGGGWRDEQAKS